MKTLLDLGKVSETGTNPPGFDGDWRVIHADQSADDDRLLDFGGVADASVDAVSASHVLEFMDSNEVLACLREVNRVLASDGFLVIFAPDLESVAAMILDGNIVETLYESESGPITPIDMLYGFRPALQVAGARMLHRSGFTQDLLKGTLMDCGFPTIATLAPRKPPFEILAIASKSIRTDEQVKELADQYLTGRTLQGDSENAQMA